MELMRKIKLMVKVKHREEENHPTNRRKERPGSSKEEQIYSNTNFTDVEEDNYWCLETPYVNHLQKEVFSDINEKKQPRRMPFVDLVLR